MSKQEHPWFVYFVRTKSRSLYCGVTNDIAKRFAAHQNGTGAKYLRGKGPLELAWSQQVDNKVTAMKLEYRLKRLPKVRKEKIITDNLIVSLD
ncbi:GIY-YIG nuclease family protein [Vibrio sp. SCSIO 43136]|uniref:GIY-YIG nuclease family protein n=1 Tax=Vibrio sp. SCSIO 43136 TaxID=2819101 RepID=UPI0020764E48|nr:GIY-YIG nuclease family protein [Vibrio sp. SCSIO 43136]USD67996.1 GIY-YIG nuclease family protein [Vibrio sp. SCSIO 43136]